MTTRMNGFLCAAALLVVCAMTQVGTAQDTDDEARPRAVATDDELSQKVAKIIDETGTELAKIKENVDASGERIRAKLDADPDHAPVGELQKLADEARRAAKVAARLRKSQDEIKAGLRAGLDKAKDHIAKLRAHRGQVEAKIARLKSELDGDGGDQTHTLGLIESYQANLRFLDATITRVGAGAENPQQAFRDLDKAFRAVGHAEEVFDMTATTLDLGAAGLRDGEGLNEFLNQVTKLVGLAEQIAKTAQFAVTPTVVN